jgi:hypothetical protein
MSTFATSKVLSCSAQIMNQLSSGSKIAQHSAMGEMVPNVRISQITQSDAQRCRDTNRTFSVESGHYGDGQ